jgi:Ankyrin repeats (many copies)
MNPTSAKGRPKNGYDAANMSAKSIPAQIKRPFEKLLAAIVRDERRKVKSLLRTNPELVSELVTRARLYRSEIFHWLYVSDTALHLAAAGYRTEIVRMLLSAGANVNAVNRRGATALHYAADGYIVGPAWDAKQQVRTMGVLLDAGAEINTQDKNGAAPLHRAVRTRCAAAVKCLLEAGGDPLLRNDSGSTPFHLAVQNTGRGGTGAEQSLAAQRQIIGLFLSRGVRPTIKNAKGKTVVEFAQSSWIKGLLAAATNDPARRGGKL